MIIIFTYIPEEDRLQNDVILWTIDVIQCMILFERFHC